MLAKRLNVDEYEDMLAGTSLLNLYFFILNFSRFRRKSDENNKSFPIYLLFGKLYRLHTDYDGNGRLSFRKMASFSSSNDLSPFIASKNVAILKALTTPQGVTFLLA